MKSDLRIAIHKNDNIFSHSTLWTNPWIEYCKNNHLNYGVVDCYQPNTIAELKKYDCLVWHFSNYVFQDMLFARSILNVAKNMGLKVFPDFYSSWHFDDKIAETYLLKSINAPVPNAWIFYLENECINWLQTEADYPLITKLRCGSGANNVHLISNYSQAKRYVKQMFRRGYKPNPSVFFKTKSNIKSAGNWNTMKNRMKRIPDFLQTLSRAKMFPREHGYVYFQEYIPNNGFDLKIVVIGDKLSFIARNVRKGDFRASGGGDLFFDKSLVSRDILESAFETSDKLGFQCMGYDYVVDKRTGIGKIVEISYGFSYTALLQAGGYWDRAYVWHDEPLNAPCEVIENLIKA
jgi:glutathione synthase/RimK-type ligase-like ATP-grasp enzyme